jgi:phage-related protein
LIKCECEHAPGPTPAEIHLEGDSREVITGFPDPGPCGSGLFTLAVTAGRDARFSDTRMESLGLGVWELKEQDERAWYRVMYLSKIDNVIYVLHCFEKRSRKTDKRGLEVAKERLARVRQRIQQQRKGTKDVRKNE